VARTVSGHPVLKPGSTDLATGIVPGSTRRITVAEWALPVLLDFLRRWQAHPSLGGGRLSLIKVGPKGRYVGPLDSYAYRPARAANAYSDHSGYAIDIRYDVLRADNKRHMTRAETRAVRELLADYGGALGWGGDYQRLIDEMHVYVAPGQTARTFAALRLKLAINPDGTRVARKPTKGVTYVADNQWTIARKRPSLHAEHAGKLRAPGFRIRYVKVVVADGETWLVTRFGNHYLADKTTRGA
jgi:hypothetical protein